MTKEKLQPTTYVSLMNDVGFKIVFGTEGNEDLMQGLLHAILPQLKITKILYVQNQAPRSSTNIKGSIYDVHCKLQDGSHVIVEVQNYAQEYFEDRMRYYSSLLVTNQVKNNQKKAKKDKKQSLDESYKLVPVYVVSILSFVRKHGKLWNGSMVSSFVYREETTGEFLSGNKTRLTFVELGLFDKTAEECETFEDKCYFCLKNMLRLDDRPGGFDGEFFDRLFLESEYATKSPEDQQAYNESMYTELDKNGQINFARKEGRKEGLAEGRNEERLNFARFMKSENYPLEKIVKQTGLSPEVVAAL